MQERAERAHDGKALRLHVADAHERRIGINRVQAEHRDHRSPDATRGDPVQRPGEACNGGLACQAQRRLNENN